MLPSGISRRCSRTATSWQRNIVLICTVFTSRSSLRFLTVTVSISTWQFLQFLRQAQLQLHRAPSGSLAQMRFSCRVLIGIRSKPYDSLRYGVHTCVYFSRTHHKLLIRGSARFPVTMEFQYSPTSRQNDDSRGTASSCRATRSQ